MAALLSRVTDSQTGSTLVWPIGDYSSGELIAYQNHGDHPEYVIRATRMLKILAGLTKDAALASMTESFQLHFRQSAAPGKR